MDPRSGVGLTARRIAAAIALAFLMLGQSCRAGAAGGVETCIASVFDEGGRLADGSRWSPARSRAKALVAHRTAPLGSHLRITRLDTGTTITVVVRDRGPYVRGRCVDLSVAAARSLAITGLARVRVEPIP